MEKKHLALAAILALLHLPPTSGQMLQPDSSLARHDFLYAGQSKQRRMFVVKNGSVDWTYRDHLKRGEISDAILTTDGHVLMAHQYGLSEVNQNNEVIWTYEAPQGTEIHTLQPIGSSHVVFVQNGHPALVRVMEIPSTHIVHEFEIPASKSIHGQFRNARITSRGTLLVCHMSQGYIAEYNDEGKQLNRWELPGAWSATELNNRTLLVVGKGNTVREIKRKGGKVVWQPDLSPLKLRQVQKAVRLDNGNTLINSWWNEWNKEPLDTANAPLQAVEIDRSGHVVWQLRSWRQPDLGPATTIQPLEQAVDRDKLHFGRFNSRKRR